MGGLLYLVQRGGAWAGCGPAQSPPRCTRCNSPSINDQCTNFILISFIHQKVDEAPQLPLGSKLLTNQIRPYTYARSRQSSYCVVGLRGDHDGETCKRRVTQLSCQLRRRVPCARPACRVMTSRRS